MARVLLRNHPLQSILFYQPDLGRRLRELAPRADLGILQLVRLAIHLDDFGDTPILVDLIDSLSLNFSLRAEVDRLWLRPLLHLEAHLLAIGERRLAERAAGMIVVCGRDRQALVNRLPPEAAARVSVVHLAMRERRAEPPLSGERLEPGGEWPGARDDREPRVLRQRGRHHLVAGRGLARGPPGAAGRPRRGGGRPAGAADPPRVAKAGPRVRLIESPRDMRSILAQATLALAPMRCGSGVPVKVLEAWAAGVPVIATPWAVAGTSGRQGEDFRVVGTHPIEWVTAILELLADPAARERLSANGRRRLAADYSREVVREQLLGVIRDLTPQPTGEPLPAPQAALRR